MRYNGLGTATLAEHVVQRGEGILASNGAISVQTGTRTGRSPKDRFIVRDQATADKVDWGSVNQPFGASEFARLWRRVSSYLDEGESYGGVMHVGAHPMHYQPVHVCTQYAWHQMFARSLFIVPEEFNPRNKPVWQVLSAPDFRCVPERDGTNSEVAIIISVLERKVLIAGVQYAGELKKAMFSVMNYLLPENEILPMHCSSNVDSSGNVALFFGLSGTGKTTLSSDPDCLLIGDDEHGWGEGSVFNFEGGCYAKCINLSRQNEPVIYDAIRFGAIIENVVIDEDTREPDYSDSSLTENTRACYPRSNVEARVPMNRAGEPSTIIFLTCDVSGVLPPVSILSRQAAAYHFLSGYTAQIGSTVVGSSEPYSATFSAGFGAAFLPRPARVYAELLVQRLKAFNSQVYLVNTGWIGGAYGRGERIGIPETRKIIRATRSGELLDVPKEHLAQLNLTIPKKIKGLDSLITNPRDAWANEAEYDAGRRSLIAKFQKNFSQFDVSEATISAGPR